MPDDVATSALDLRSIFRDSEARAARLKLLIEVSRDLAATDGDRLIEAVDRAAQRAALFAGYGAGRVGTVAEPAADGALVIPLSALAARGREGVSLTFSTPLNPAAISSQEDADALRLMVEMIEARLIVDLQRRKEAELLKRLERREKALEQVLSRVVTAQEGERAAISADLHDGVAQQVAALHRRLELVHLDLTPRDPRMALEIGALIEVARKAVSDLRGVIAGLRPLSLDDLGVAAALREEARRLEAAGHVVKITDRVGRRLPDWLETLLFRVAQEAFNNVAKHAPGATVNLEFDVGRDGEEVVLSIEDAGGQGPRATASDQTPRFGLDMMRERLSAVAGSLEAGPTARGYRIRAVAPLTEV
ncbi:sensor histidine kinase [Brevundimonas balnearis]|uniref:histidine kinase n=1 Tax=Brevundimonas balnearis TaxID=1572858 RepID=A0ABV6R1T7_9CAUL